MYKIKHSTLFLHYILRENMGRGNTILPMLLLRVVNQRQGKQFGIEMVYG